MMLAAFWFGCALSQPPVGPDAPAEEPRPATARADATRTHVVMLGTGNPVPDPSRSGPCVAVVVDDRAYLVDMGPGLVRRAASAHMGGITALDPERLNRVFVTHLHSDHTAGFPDLWLSPWVIGRTGPLNVHGPIGINNMATHLSAAWSEDIEVRTTGLEKGDAGGAAIVVKENPAEGGEVYRDAWVTVSAIPVPHGSWKYAYGYKFETPDRTIVISGDTAKSEALAAACDGCDLLVHEVFSQAAWDMRPPSDFKNYHATFHTSTTELGELAIMARPKKLLLYHQLYMGADDAGLVAEVKAVWDGDVESASDLGIY